MTEDSLSLHEFLELRDSGEPFLILIHKGGNPEELIHLIEYIPTVDPELFFVDINDSDGAQIQIECSASLLPTVIMFKNSNVVYKDWLVSE